MNKTMNIEESMATAAPLVAPPLLFEMIRSFVSLASTLNISHSVRELGSTRQTLRRHISNLEAAMGGPLFMVEDRRYQLSALGKQALPDARELLARGNLWMRGQMRSVDRLQLLHAETSDWDFYQQQQPLGRIWTDPSVLLRETFRAWAMSGGEIENPLFSHVRPYVIIYRQSDIGWICVEFGQKSVYVNWFGLDYALSSIGRPLQKMPAGEEFSHLIYEAFDEVQSAQMARLDHVFTRMPRQDKGPLIPVAYQRLIMSGFFPDRSPAVLSLVQPVDVPNIEGLSDEQISTLEPIGRLDFPMEKALFEAPGTGS